MVRTNHQTNSGGGGKRKRYDMIFACLFEICSSVYEFCGSKRERHCTGIIVVRGIVVNMGFYAFIVDALGVAGLEFLPGAHVVV